MRAFVLLALAAVALALPLTPKPPTFPQKYFFEGVFSIPEYGIIEPLTVYTDEVADMQRVVTYNRDTFLTRGDLGIAYEVVPKIDQFVCFSSNVSGPTSNSADVPLSPFLPDISDWEYAGEKIVRNIPCHIWEHQMKNFSMTAHYRFAVSVVANEPVQLQLEGFNFIQSSHPDLYVLDYNLFVPSVDPHVFAVPELCNSKADFTPTPERVAARIRAMVQRLARVIPPHHKGCDVSHEFKTFLTRHGKRYSSCDETQKREATYKKNLAYIAAHNARNDKRHTLAENHFADMEDDEFRNLMLMPKKSRAHNNGATRQHAADPKDDLPAALDWREKGAISKPQDQGVCGSCWAFGSVSSLEGVYYVSQLKKGLTPKLIETSEQQLVDCAWGYEDIGGPGGDLACDGGFASSAFQWMTDNGGVALKQTYRYEMQDGWCNKMDKSSGIKVNGYVNVTGIDDLKHALATVGPVAIAIDASHPSFRFYSGGIYYESECKSDIDDLDHEVAAVGYGVASDNTPYFIVKNSWSDSHWGDKGFIYMSAKNNNCGVASQGTYPIVA